MLKRKAMFALPVMGLLLLTSCASNSDGTSAGSGPTTSGSSASSAPSPSTDDTLTALVPAALKSSGKLVIGTDPTYAPNEYKDASGKIVGFDIDLFDAVAAKLGLKTQYVGATFDNIIPSVVGGTYQLGVSSFTDNADREKKVDMVSYYNAGMQWVAATGSKITADTACGTTFAVQTGTVEADDLAARSTTCTKAGKKAISIQKFDAQGDATNAVVLGKVDAMSADYPVAVDAVKQSKGKIDLVGAANYDAAPYGYAIGKTQGTLKEAIQKAVQALIDDGSYTKILDKWGVTAGAIKTAKINTFSS